MIKRRHDLMEVETKVKIDTMTKEIDSIRKAKDIDISKLKDALMNHIEDSCGNTNQLDELRIEVSEAKALIETMTVKERETEKILNNAMQQKEDEMISKNETISAYEMELTVSCFVF